MIFCAPQGPGRALRQAVTLVIHQREPVARGQRQRVDSLEAETFRRMRQADHEACVKLKGAPSDCP